MNKFARKKALVRAATDCYQITFKHPIVQTGKTPVTGDCLYQAHLLSRLLSERGIKNRIACGWHVGRVGKGSGDAVVSLPDTVAKMYSNPSAMVNLPYHYWVRVDEYIVDCTLWQAPYKLKELDAIDGQTSTPDYPHPILVIKEKNTVPMQQARDSYNYAFYYEEISAPIPDVSFVIDEYLENLQHVSPGLEWLAV